MKKKRLRPYVVPIFSAVLFSALLITVLSLTNKVEENNDFTYVSNSIVNDTIPVINEVEDVYIVRPYQNDQITICKKFYDGNENRENSIILFNDTYIQNTGIIYTSNEEFGVVSILNGEVIDIKQDELLGNVVTIKHDNDFISIYEGLKTLYVNKGDRVLQNTMIGKSGPLSFEVNLPNALLFELSKNGSFVNPEEYYDKNINEL